MAVTLRYFTELGKPALQETICGGIYASVYCIFQCVYNVVVKKFTFAISSPDEFLVSDVIDTFSAELHKIGNFLKRHAELTQAYFLPTCPVNLITINKSKTEVV